MYLAHHELECGIIIIIIVIIIVIIKSIITIIIITIIVVIMKKILLRVHIVCAFAACLQLKTVQAGQHMALMCWTDYRQLLVGGREKATCTQQLLRQRIAVWLWGPSGAPGADHQGPPHTCCRHTPPHHSAQAQLHQPQPH